MVFSCFFRKVAALLPRSSAALAFILCAAFLFPGQSSGGVDKPSFWISRLKSPDKVILNTYEIEELNRTIIARSDQMADLSTFPERVSGEQVREWIAESDLPGGDTRLLNSHGERLTIEFLSGLEENMDTGSVGEAVAVRFGVVTHRADIRAFPTDEGAFKGRGSDFDQFQYSNAYPPEAAILLHTSRDGRWGFFQTFHLRGWMRLDNVAFAERHEALRAPEDFIVVTDSRARVYLDEQMKLPLTEIPMGAAIEKVEKTSKHWKVRFPVRAQDGSLALSEAYIPGKAGVSSGYLPYTRGNVIRQAFKMLGERYSWGGKDGERDCSLFIRDLFATMGVRLPRNSGSQQYVGEVKASHVESGLRGIFKALNSAEPGITLLGMKRHIMLFLGKRNGRPYVIHQVAGFENNGRMKTLNRVAVTDLGAAKRLKKTIKSRIRTVTTVTIPSA